MLACAAEASERWKLVSITSKGCKRFDELGLQRLNASIVATLTLTAALCSPRKAPWNAVQAVPLKLGAHQSGVDIQFLQHTQSLRLWLLSISLSVPEHWHSRHPVLLANGLGVASRRFPGSRSVRSS